MSAAVDNSRLKAHFVRRHAGRRRREMMKRMKTILALLVVTSITCIGLRGYAQPNIPKEKIPSHIPADVRQQIERLYSSDAIERASASFWLRKMGAQAVPAIPFLIAILGDNTVIEGGGPSTSPGEEAARTLITIGKPAVQPLMTALKDEHLSIRRMAAWILGKMKDPRTVDPLIAALKDESRVVRMMAAWALGEIGKPAVEPLITALKDKDSPARGDAAWALGKIKDPRAVGPLIAALKDEKPNIQEDAAEALEKITEKNFGVDPVKWQNWWEQNKGNVGSGG
jgi:hypothetical protein